MLLITYASVDGVIQAQAEELVETWDETGSKSLELNEFIAMVTT